MDPCFVTLIYVEGESRHPPSALEGVLREHLMHWVTMVRIVAETLRLLLHNFLSYCFSYYSTLLTFAYRNVGSHLGRWGRWPRWPLLGMCKPFGSFVKFVSECVFKIRNLKRVVPKFWSSRKWIEDATKFRTEYITNFLTSNRRLHEIPYRRHYKSPKINRHHVIPTLSVIGPNCARNSQ